VMSELVQQHLSRAQLRMKKQADQGRSERSFAVGDQVFLKLQHYVQSSLAPRANQKLAFKYFGPFSIVANVGTVAYRLQLPASSSIHPLSMQDYPHLLWFVVMFSVMLISPRQCLFVLLRLEEQVTEETGAQQVEDSEQKLTEGKSPLITLSLPNNVHVNHCDMLRLI
jgi:hypothetical protein